MVNKFVTGMSESMVYKTINWADIYGVQKPQ